MNKEKLKDFLSRQFYKSDEDLGVCFKLVCKHIGAAKAGDVFQIMVPHTETVVKINDDELEIMANQIEGSAAEDAEGLGGVCKYQLHAYFTKSPRPVARFTFRMAGAELDEYEDAFSEPGTVKGHTTQMMRHNEALVRICVMGANQTIGLMNRSLARKEEQIEKLLDGRMKDFELMEDLRSQQHLRELETKAEEAKQQRYDDLYQKGKVLLPVIANRIAGKKLLPEGNPMGDAIQAFAESLDPAQASDIMAKLKPEQKIAFIEVLEAMHKKEDEESPEGKGGANGA
jgi:hypothetical protein